MAVSLNISLDSERHLANGHGGDKSISRRTGVVKNVRFFACS